MCLHHKHLEWAKYIKGELVDRDDYEQSLATCDSCLEDYLQYLDLLESPQPGFVDAVMAGLSGDNAIAPNARKYSTYKPLLHYLVAASLTLVLLELEVFDWIPRISDGSLKDIGVIGEVLTRFEEFIGLINN